MKLEFLPGKRRKMFVICVGVFEFKNFLTCIYKLHLFKVLKGKKVLWYNIIILFDLEISHFIRKLVVLGCNIYYV